MKILLTGRPRSGKTTLLEDFIQSIPSKQGFISREVQKHGERQGFEVISSAGKASMLASTESNSGSKVGKYGVNVEAFNLFLATLPQPRPNAILYIDEIGKMQLFSEKFKTVVRQYLSMPNVYVGTISSTYESDFITEVLERSDVVLLTVNPDNRLLVKEVLNGLASNVNQLQKLDRQAQQKLIAFSQKYAKTSQWLQLKKLWKNAIRYIAEKRVEQISPTIFTVKGNTGDHKVVANSRGMSCDCDLFNGTGVFKGIPGECSHIQAVEIFI